jgi:transposase
MKEMSIRNVAMNSALEFAQAGMSREEIIAKFNISNRTMNRWFDRMVSEGIRPPMQFWKPKDIKFHSILLCTRDFPDSTFYDVKDDLRRLYGLKVTMQALKIAVTGLKRLGMIKVRRMGRGYRWHVNKKWKESYPPTLQPVGVYPVAK